jgi:hypothetical protein
MGNCTCANPEKGNGEVAFPDNFSSPKSSISTQNSQGNKDRVSDPLYLIRQIIRIQSFYRGHRIRKRSTPSLLPIRRRLSIATIKAYAKANRNPKSIVKKAYDYAPVLKQISSENNLAGSYFIPRPVEIQAGGFYVGQW